jgi:hypothetical protein
MGITIKHEKDIGTLYLIDLDIYSIFFIPADPDSIWIKQEQVEDKFKCIKLGGTYKFFDKNTKVFKVIGGDFVIKEIF